MVNAQRVPPRRSALAAMALVALAATALAPAALAQQPPWPSKPIRVIVPYAAGGVVDVMTRAVTARMSVDLGQPIVVEAKPGANANIGADAVAKVQAGADVVQIYTGLIYRGPALVREAALALKARSGKG